MREQLLHHGGSAARVMEITRDVLSTGLQARDDGCRGRDAVEVFERELDTEFVRERHQVQHAVRRPTGTRDADDRVLERLSRDDLRRTDAARGDVEREPARSLGGGRGGGSRPAASAAAGFAGSVAGMLPRPTAPSPRKSTAIAIVFAVKWPWHAPHPGQACRSIASSSSSVIWPTSCAPTASHTSWIVSCFPFSRPGAIAPL